MACECGNDCCGDEPGAKTFDVEAALQSAQIANPEWKVDMTVGFYRDLLERLLLAERAVVGRYDPIPTTTLEEIIADLKTRNAGINPEGFGL